MNDEVIPLEKLGKRGTVRVYTQSYVEQLKKENAELKDKLNNLASVAEVRLANWQKYSKKLKEAKELIRQLCSMVRELNKPNVQLTNVDYSLAEAEQFISEVEK